MSEFDELWKLFPRKMKKAEARKVYEKMRSEGALPPFPELKEAVLRYSASVQGKLKSHISYFSSWLEGERFEDDLEVSIYKPKRDSSGRTLAEKVKAWHEQTKYLHYSNDEHDPPNRGQDVSDRCNMGPESVDKGDSPGVGG